MPGFPKIFNEKMNKPADKKKQKSDATYGTIAKAMSAATKTAMIPLPAAEEPQVYAVDVEFVKYGMDKPEEEIGEPVPTPIEKINPFEQFFGQNNWWLRGTDGQWYAYDKYLERLEGLDRKSERIYGLWVNLTSPNRKCVINRWNDGDASIEKMSETSNGTKQETIGPADREWKMPLWMKAQPFRIVCHNNPFLEGQELEFSDHTLDETFDRDDSTTTPPRTRFLSVETPDVFTPKTIYPRNDHYERIFFR